MKKLFTVFVLVLTSIAANVATLPGLEQLMGVIVDDNGITFQVNSNGCSFRRDFDFHVEERLEQMGPHLPAFEHHYYITVKRLRADVCDRFAATGARLYLSFEELGIQFGKFHVTNPIGGEKIISVPASR
jgi:hypothetical protein